MTISRPDAAAAHPRSGGPPAEPVMAAASRPDLVTGVAVIGAGPAGLSAAVAAADAGAVVALIDAESAVGGQFWRHPARADEPGAVTDRDVAGLHHQLDRYRQLRRRLDQHVASGVLSWLPRHEVWAVHAMPSPVAGGDPAGPRFVVDATVTGPSGRTPATVPARSLVLATGAYDLQVPFPGWDLPGVMTAGGVQSLLKGHAVLAGRRVVVAGTGPFLLPVASGLARSGAAVLGVFEAARRVRWLREWRALVRAGSELAEAVGYARDLARHRIRYRTGWTVLRAAGGDQLDSVVVAPLDRAGSPVTDRARVLRADILAVGWGFVPQLDLALALGCGTAPGPGGLPVAQADAEQRSTVPGVYLAGEICGVGGAALAAVQGSIAGAAAAGESGPAAGGRGAAATAGDGPWPTLVDGRSPTQRDGASVAGRRSVAPGTAAQAGPDRRRAALRRFAEAMHRVYPVPDCWLGGLTVDTVVCRCEEVTAGEIRAVVRQDGVTDARTAKLLVRPGMGWCQGRVCGYAVERVVADVNGVPAVHRPVERPVAVPVPLGLLTPGSDRISSDPA